MDAPGLLGTAESALQLTMQTASLDHLSSAPLPELLWLGQLVRPSDFHWRDPSLNPAWLFFLLHGICFHCTPNEALKFIKWLQLYYLVAIETTTWFRQGSRFKDFGFVVRDFVAGREELMRPQAWRRSCPAN